MGLWFGSMTNENTGVIGTRTATGNIAFQTHSGGWGERMRLTYDGKVGIGTASPDTTLVVANDSNQMVVRTNQATAAQRAGGGFHSIGHATQGSRLARFWLDADGANFSGSDYFYIQKTGGGDVDLILQNAANMKLATSGTTRMTIGATGNVGIGVAAGASRFTIGGTLESYSSAIQFDNNTT